MDSEGTLSLYDKRGEGFGDATWIPVFVPNEEVPYSVWPIHIYGDKMSYVQIIVYFFFLLFST